MKFRRLAFWCLTPITVPVLIASCTMVGVAQAVIDELDSYERWPFRF